MSVLDNSTLWVSISFIIFLALIIKPASKSLAELLEERIKNVKKEIEDSAFKFQENIDSKKLLFDGNTYFENQDFNTAEYNYRKSYSKDSLNSSAPYNLGNSLYKNNLSPEARFNYSQSIKKLSDKESLHKAYHNLGNTYMQEENYQGAVDAFKRSLLNNPNDEETRYNYVLAKELLLSLIHI